MTYESPRLRKRNAVDYAKDAGVFLFSTISPLGGVGHLLEEYGPNRYNEWIEAIRHYLSELPSELFESDEFIRAAHRAHVLMGQLHLTSKAEMLAAGLRKIATEPDQWDDEIVTRMFLMIERLTPLHIQTMQLMKASRSSATAPKDTAQAVLSLMRGYGPGGMRGPTVGEGAPLLQMAIARDLHELNLIDADRADANKVFRDKQNAPSWYGHGLLSAEGQHLLEFLEHFVNSKALSTRSISMRTPLAILRGQNGSMVGERFCSQPNPWR